MGGRTAALAIDIFDKLCAKFTNPFVFSNYYKLNFIVVPFCVMPVNKSDLSSFAK